ncbi:hypothetical protein [Streptomyces erythrochromogenes]|uniref:hypothetical protein n=1 Tax=Streptomyces erythrochromogenes TaxID=285574 RepID=UPI0004CDBAF8|nr:hypothetical protein [Streptomyces erythrochromogenes]
MTLWRQVLAALAHDTLGDAEREAIVARGAAQLAIRRIPEGQQPTPDAVLDVAFKEFALLLDTDQARAASVKSAAAVGDPGGPRGVEPDVTTMRLMPVIGVQRSDSETVSRRAELETIFTALAARWESDGRADEEWALLARHYPWPGR